MMRVIKMAFLSVFRGSWFKSAVSKVRVEEWKEIKLENIAGRAQNPNQNGLKYFIY